MFDGKEARNLGCTGWGMVRLYPGWLTITRLAPHGEWVLNLGSPEAPRGAVLQPT